MTIGCILISIALYKKQVCNILQDQLQHGIGIDGNDRKCTKADTTVKKSDKISSTTAVDIPITVNESYTSVSFDLIKKIIMLKYNAFLELSTSNDYDQP